MSSRKRSPSPESSPNADPPTSTDTSPPPPPPPEPESESPPPPEQPPPPPPRSSAPPPEIESSPPPPPPDVPSDPPPPPPELPPRSPPPPSPPPQSPPPSPPPSPPSAPPPPPTPSPPPPKESPAPEVSPPPPPPPPQPQPPPPPSDPPSPPPPSPDSPPPTATPPPPPHAHSPKHSPPPPPTAPTAPPPTITPPIPSPSLPPPISPPPPPTLVPSPSLSPSISPPLVPSPSLSPSISPSPLLNNSSINGSITPSPLPSLPPEKPTARSTQSSPNVTSDSSSGNSGSLRAGGVAVVGSVVGLLAISLVILAVFFTHKRKKRKDRFKLNYALPSPFASSQNSDSSFLRPQYSAQLAGSPSTNNFAYSQDGGGMGASRSWFTYEELSVATDGFSVNKKLGEGGFGAVYLGVLTDGREVAVKQLKAGSGQGEREFRAEVEIISRIHHRHLVSLVGYCISDDQRLLVYDYVPNDTLHHHLYDKDKVMDWASRVKVATGAARGLAYLHEDCQPRIIHRDIKSTNILLENNFEARVADFGLAKLALELDLHTHVSTRVMGTFGYLSPEYASTGKLTEKSDVFSFGVVLLELITGRRPVDASQPFGDESLVEWARPLLTQALETEDFEDLVDSRLETNFIASEMLRMIEAAAACVRHLASKRPKMSQVARALDSMEELADLNNGVKPGQSGIFTSREHSAQIKMFQRMAFGNGNENEDYSSEYYNNSQTWRTNL